MKYTEEQMREFIKESNAIESVWTEEAILDSLDAWDWLSDVETLTLMDILMVHADILQHIDPEIAGKLRGELGIDVFIGGYKACAFWNVGSRICDWLRHINDKKLPQWSAEDIKRYHISFEDTHPFVDGNGRTGRLIYCWMREKMNLPIHIIKNDTKHEDYYTWFRR